LIRGQLITQYKTRGNAIVECPDYQIPLNLLTNFQA